jgi:hypothetical protein
MKCPEGFCRDAEHCMQGGRCEDAVGELSPLVSFWDSDEFLHEDNIGPTEDYSTWQSVKARVITRPIGATGRCCEEMP